jgi:hypothetical protein
MIYRYFYTSTGDIQGVTAYKNHCFQVSCCDSVDYIDNDVKVSAADYRVDPETKTLVPKQSE